MGAREIRGLQGAGGEVGLRGRVRPQGEGSGEKETTEQRFSCRQG